MKGWSKEIWFEMSYFYFFSLYILWRAMSLQLIPHLALGRGGSINEAFRLWWQNICICVSIAWSCDLKHLWETCLQIVFFNWFRRCSLLFENLNCACTPWMKKKKKKKSPAKSSCTRKWIEKKNTNTCIKDLFFFLQGMLKTLARHKLSLAVFKFLIIIFWFIRLWW